MQPGKWESVWGHIEKINDNELVKKINEIKTKDNRRRSKPDEKWMEVNR